MDYINLCFSGVPDVVRVIHINTHKSTKQVLKQIFVCQCKTRLLGFLQLQMYPLFYLCERLKYNFTVFKRETQSMSKSRSNATKVGLEQPIKYYINLGGGGGGSHIFH